MINVCEVNDNLLQLTVDSWTCGHLTVNDKLQRTLIWMEGFVVYRFFLYLFVVAVGVLLVMGAYYSLTSIKVKIKSPKASPDGFST